MTFIDEKNALPPEAVHALKAHWLATVLFGLVLALAGGFAVSAALLSTVATVIFVGFAMMISGFAEVFHAFAMRTWGHFLWLLLGGAIYILAGGLVVRDPIFAASFITLMLGAGLVASGIIRSYVAFQLPSGGNKGFLIASGILTLVVGALIVAQWPTSSLWLIGTLLGIDMFFSGMGWIGVGLSMRKA